MAFTRGRLSSSPSIWEGAISGELRRLSGVMGAGYALNMQRGDGLSGVTSVWAYYLKFGQKRDLEKRLGASYKKRSVKKRVSNSRENPLYKNIQSFCLFSHETAARSCFVKFGWKLRLRKRLKGPVLKRPIKKKREFWTLRRKHFDYLLAKPEQGRISSLRLLKIGYTKTFGGHLLF